MFQFNCFEILIFTFLLSCANSDVQFNSLYEKLVLTLMRVTQKQNVVASEQLLRFPLCKLASVATGETKQELMSLLGYKDDAALSQCYYRIRPNIRAMAMHDLTVMNRIFLNYTSEIDPRFIANAADEDGLTVAKISFNYPKAAIAHINNVVNFLTFKRIRDIVDDNDINRTTKMMILSGAHYRTTWDNPFDYRLTKLTRFHQMDGKTTSIPMMSQVASFLYNSPGNCEVLSIRLKAWRASMTFVMPTSAKEMPNLLDTIYDQKGISSFIKGLQYKHLRVKIPKFKIKTFVDWTGFLQGFGLYSVFDPSSLDLSGIYVKEFQNKSMNLNKIKQKVFIQVDESGAFTHLPDPYEIRAPNKPVLQVQEFTADKPFYFEISIDFEDGGHYPVITGVYYGPEPDPVNF